MIDGLDTMMIAAGLGGAVVGALLRHVLGPKGPKPSNRDFTRKQMNTWNINDEWYNILSHKKKEEFSSQEIEKLVQHIQEKESERKKLRVKQDSMLNRMKEVKHLVAAAEGKFEVGTILTRMGDISAEASSIRIEFDRISNALVNFHQSKSFLECVKTGMSKEMIIKEMNRDNLRYRIDNNDSLGHEMLSAELDALGPDSRIEEFKRALGISN